jgi:acyl-CoA dehydrogenase
MTGCTWFCVFMIATLALAYQRASLIVITISFTVLMLLMTALSTVSTFCLVFWWILFLILFVPFNVPPLRKRFFSKPVLTFYRKIMPYMSRTEAEALAAGTVSWEGDMFCGAPDWDRLLNLSKPALTAEEQAFIDGPVTKLCDMIDDWDITHNRADLPPEMWQFLKDEGFFSLIIPKQYGGKEFSAYLHSQMLAKVYALSATVGSTVSVPNSLGPAELLFHYGTTEQKDYYLPRLASGEDVPCFALTGPDAGSDAGSMPDTGVVCKGKFDGKMILGLRLNFNKRYITLAPIATVIGLAFKMLDPDHLLGDKENLGITCALIPRDTLHLTAGRRHLPLNVVFQNGPVHGKDVFIPLDYIIGGPKMAGQGWRMLMECLAAGRAISLPGSATGSSKMLTYTTGAYARIRRQFNISIGKFEGVQMPLARIAALTYMIDAGRSFTAAAIDRGEKPSIASAILKYHTTEMGRIAANDAMDIHGGKGICLGPNNYLGRGYESVPIAITVEGANILTRNLIIFGQGAMRCHPYIYSELQAAQMQDEPAALTAFDKAIIGHLGYSISNFARALILNWTGGIFSRAPGGKTRRYFQKLKAYSAGFALTADMSLIILGGALKRKETISARLGDILSYLYMASALLKHFHEQQSPDDDMPVVKWACEYYFMKIEEAFFGLFQNFSNRFAAFFWRLIIFPLGRSHFGPKDKLSTDVAELVMSPTPTRTRIIAGIPEGTHLLQIVEDALLKSMASEPVEKVLKKAQTDKTITGITLSDLAKSALAAQIISAADCATVVEAELARHLVIAVDDFAPEDLIRVGGDVHHATATKKKPK